MQQFSTRGRTSVAALFIAFSAAFSCKGTPPAQVGTSPANAGAKGPATPNAPGPELLPSHVVATVDNDGESMLFARRKDSGLALYTSKSRFWTRALNADGSPRGAPINVAPAVDLAGGLEALRPVGDGYVAVWAERVAKNRAIKYLVLDAAGNPKGEPGLVVQLADDLSWVDVAPNGKGALIVWEIARGDRKEVDFIPLVGNKLVGSAVLALKDVLHWEGVATEKGYATASVVAEVGSAPPKTSKGGKKVEVSDSEPTGAGRTGRVVFTEFDTSGKPGPQVVVSAPSSAQTDVALAALGNRFVFAWTDDRELDACVYVAAVEGGKVVSQPRRATSPTGEQALVSLVASSYEPGSTSSKRAVLAWEDMLKTSRDGRLVHLATLNPDASLNAERATVTLVHDGPPDLVTDGDGFALTTLAPIVDAEEQLKVAPAKSSSKRPREEGAPVSETPVWPAFVRFGRGLEVKGSEPVRAAPYLANDGVPYLMRSLSCQGGTCLTLTSGAGADVPLAMVSLPARATPWRPVAQRDPDEGPPRSTFVGAIYSGDHIAKVAAAEVPGGNKLAAWVTYFVDGATRAGKGKPVSDDAPAARLEVRSIAPGAASLGLAGKTVMISQKALSIGGVSLAPAPPVKDKPAETVLGWVAKERGEPQVFVTKLDPDGKKLAQKGVTVIGRKKKGKGDVPSEASDVSVAYDGADGWIVAWVDTREGNAEVFVAKVDRSLTKVIPDKRITDAPGDAADVQIAVRGKETFLIWSDARQNTEEGNGDIYLARLDTASLKKMAPETKLFASPTHSRSPSLVPTPNGLMAYWIEEGDGTSKGPQPADAGLRIAQLDDRGNVTGSPLLVRAEGSNRVTSATIACRAKPCHGVLTSAAADALFLNAFDVTPGAAPGPMKNIASLTGSATQDVSPSFPSGNAASLFFADDAIGGQGRVRWMEIAWTK